MLKVSSLPFDNFEVESDPPEMSLYTLGCIALSEVSHRQRKVIRQTIPAVEDHLYRSISSGPSTEHWGTLLRHSIS